MLEEKPCILKGKNRQNLLNKKSEIVSTCNYKIKYLVNYLKKMEGMHTSLTPTFPTVNFLSASHRFRKL